MAIDPLTAATNSILWPYLRGKGFVKVTARRFARKRGDVYQQLWIDAKGVAGMKSTRMVLLAMFPFESVDGYFDPHGWWFGDGRTRDMSTAGKADAAMPHVVDALERTELSKLDALDSTDVLLERLEGWPDWREHASKQMQRWRAGDPELLAAVAANARRLKLA